MEIFFLILGIVGFIFAISTLFYKANKEKRSSKVNKLELYKKDKKYLYENFYNQKDNNDFYLYMVRLIYNSFITNHILIDGNKRYFKKEMEWLNKLVKVETLK